MTEAVTQSVDSTQELPPETVERQVGRQLENARKALQLGVGDMARSLYLSEKQVLALETGNLAALPGRTFVRGFVRNYARAVQIDAAPLLNLLDSVDKPVSPILHFSESTHVAMPSQKRGAHQDTLAIVAGVALVIVAIALYFFLPDQFGSKKGQEVDSVQNPQSIPLQPSLKIVDHQPFPSPDGAVVPSQIETPIQTRATVTSPVVIPQSPVTPLPKTSAVSPPAPTVGNGHIHFTFGGESWVEVRDKNGKVLSSGQHPPGTQHEVSGAPPLTIIVGRASGVELRYQGQPVTLRPNADSDIARVVLP
jgi:cytoskeleton protein RodZ